MDILFYVISGVLVLLLVLGVFGDDIKQHRNFHNRP